MPVRLADTAGRQREHQEAGLLPLEDREVVLVGLLEPAPVMRAAGLLAETEEVGLRGDRLGGYAGITKARSIVRNSHRSFLLSAISGAAGDEAIHTHACRGTSARQACRTQDLATIHRHAREPSVGMTDVS
jgi:hypothetical protein